jgi:hypothetical protein
MVFNATFNNISVISWDQFYWWRKPECPEKTTGMLYLVDLAYTGLKVERQQQRQSDDNTSHGRFGEIIKTKVKSLKVLLLS